MKKVERPDRRVERLPGGLIVRFVASQLHFQNVEEERQPLLEDLTLAAEVELVHVVADFMNLLGIDGQDVVWHAAALQVQRT